MFSEHLTHQTLIGCFGVFEDDKRYVVVIEFFVSDEHNVLLIGNVHEDMVITLVGIHDAEQLMICGSINKLINSGKRADADLMANDIKRDARHIIIRPGEELGVFSSEDNNCSP
ncbi:unnamed protein product [Prunus armeniaca]